VPLPGDHSLYVVYRAFEGDGGIDYLLYHPDWDAAERLAQDDGTSWAQACPGPS
jgi:hypothetical protein